MSAITGPRQSPPSPWPQESPSLQLAGSSTPAPLFSLQSNISPLNTKIGSQGTIPERPTPNYFSISVDNSSNTPDSKQGPNSIKYWDRFSYAQSPGPNANAQFLSNKTVLEGYMNLQKATQGFDGRTEFVIPGPSANRGLRIKESSSDPSNTSMHLTPGNFNTVSVERCAELLESLEHDVMFLDVRPYAHYVKANIRGSLNLCIPTTLLKRPSYDTQKLANTFTGEPDKKRFARWRDCRYIVVYDAATSDMKDAGPMVNVLKKFTAEGWDGEGLVLCGGFDAFSNRFPTLTQQQQSSAPGLSLKKPDPSMQISLPSTIAGGCALPEESSSAIPFFGSIRQHMDLVGGVGQIALHLPENFTESKRQSLPRWLREASDPKDKGRKVSEKFLDLEKKELERMKQAFSYQGSGDSTSTEGCPKRYRVAGIEKGSKNRYNDIYPFDHSRVRLQGVSSGGCDYVNANYINAKYSNKSYIATQAPVPGTFNDFWRVIWEQDVRLIVSLTAEVERGQVKCHPYWESGNYGPLQVNNFSQKYIYMNSPDSQQVSSGPNKPPLGTNEDSSNPRIILRHFSLSHSDSPFEPLRDVTQLQYPYWPDFGTTKQPAHLLKLIEQCDMVTRETSSAAFAEPKGQRPVLVHCSAGCGRTGTFCTVDSVLDILKRQRTERTTQSRDSVCDIVGNEWISNENLDLIAETVADFRTQRPSMIQNLSQFVLCYDSVLDWLLSQKTDEDMEEL